MISQANNIKSYEWWAKQPYDKWLNINDIPNCIFHVIMDTQIQKSLVSLHPSEAKYKKHKYNVHR